MFAVEQGYAVKIIGTSMENVKVLILVSHHFHLYSLQCFPCNHLWTLEYDEEHSNFKKAAYAYKQIYNFICQLK